MTQNTKIEINASLVRQLITTQFPKWKDLPIKPIEPQGWDNRTFRLGDEMSVRMPSAADYALQVDKEHQWLPKLAPLLPLAIPEPLAIGQPAAGYPWKWSIYRWLVGKPAATAGITDFDDFAKRLAQFLVALQQIDSTCGPKPGLHSFYRGGPLTIYDAETRNAMHLLKDKIDTQLATEVWEQALATSWQKSPVWVHGDVSVGNLLVQKNHLCAVIDFGQLTIGDPACDLAIAWTLFKGKSRAIFHKTLQLDDNTWARGRAWTLWKALIIAADLVKTNTAESTQCWHIIDEVLKDHKLHMND